MGLEYPFALVCMEPFCTASPHLSFCYTWDIPDPPRRTPEASHRFWTLVLAPPLYGSPRASPSREPSAKRQTTKFRNTLWDGDLGGLDKYHEAY